MNLFKKFLLQLLSIAEKITRSEIRIRRGSLIRIRLHPKAVSNGLTMQLYGDLTKKICNFSPQNIFEIGANYGQDAEYLRKYFKLAKSCIYVFEPHPQIFPELRDFYGFQTFELAVSNQDGRASFNAVDIYSTELKNTGISSLRENLTTDSKNFVKADVRMTRMDSFIKENNISNIDFLKIDVEGMNFEVLEGFGNEIKRIKLLQIEAENKPFWDGQKLYADIEKLLVKNGFELVHYMLSADGIQSDSFWIQKPYFKNA